TRRVPDEPVISSDLAVVGAGAAGLYAALRAASAGVSVVLVSATPLAQTASYWAQGGIAAALAVEDSFERHLADTQTAGRPLAHAAGAQLADLEFLQFPPTAVIGIAGREGFLVTEAIRGEGATLHGPDGERFVEELAPRDEVSRAIAALLTSTGATAVGLDMR